MVTIARAGLSFLAFAGLAACVVQPADAPPPDARPVPVSAGGTQPAPGSTQPATGEPDYTNLPKPGPLPTGTGQQAEPTRDCPSVQCRMHCDHGFLKDARGCEVCQCAAAPTAGPPPSTPPAEGCACGDDDDCVKVGDAGCCGCNAGGEEIAVAKACLDQVPKCEQRGAVACPQVYQCTERKAVCRRGVCVLNK